jgi:NAD(P)-dependent dehydrogenase (short-subunit alcohol dehydrogenase family)
MSARPKLLLTGASSGVGHSLAKHLSARFDVIAGARRVDRIREAFAGNAHVHPCFLDLTDLPGTESALDRILAERGPILHVINNAGIFLKQGIEALTSEQWANCLNVNALSPWLVLKKVLPGMRECGFGRVINITSGAPLNCSPGFAAYSATKAALNAMTVTAAKECAAQDIKINLMSPGPVHSEMAPTGPMEPEVCHPTVDYLLSLGTDGPTGRFFWLGYEVPLFPDLAGVNWLEGKGNEKLRKVL